MIDNNVIYSKCILDLSSRILQVPSAEAIKIISVKNRVQFRMHSRRFQAIGMNINSIGTFRVVRACGFPR